MPTSISSLVSSPVRPTSGASLDPYVPSAEKPWNIQRVMHVYDRLGYGASWNEIQQGLAMSPGELIDMLLDGAATATPPTPPLWANWTEDDYAANPDLFGTHKSEFIRQWFSELIHQPVRAKMVMFWRNHFVTENRIADCNNYLWAYFTLMNTMAFGNFQAFTKAVGKDAAMLVYLNGNLNVAGQPNQNYARELMELFTMGESNGYTQTDIEQMARALTGWKANYGKCYAPYFNPPSWDNTDKTIFGQTANFDFDGAHDAIFLYRPERVAQFIPKKIYKHFVYATPDTQILEAMGQTLMNSNWELMPMLKEIFKSDHFFEEDIMAAHVKSPVETFIPILRMAGVTDTGYIVEDKLLDSISYWCYRLGQDILNPPGVSGWPGHRAWINETTLTSRWSFAANLLSQLEKVPELREYLRNFALQMTNQSNDPVVVTDALITYFTGQTLEDVHRKAAVAYLKEGIPENYFQDGSWNLYWDEAPYQIFNCWNFLTRLPESQLT
jgi:uncharacterized protein (DUF1800 family)